MDSKQPCASQLQNNTAPTNKKPCVCFSSTLHVTMGTLRVVVFPGLEMEKKRRKKKSACTMVSNFRLEASYIFKTIFLTKLITEKTLMET